MRNATISFQSGRSRAALSLKRYRFTGKERDEETGMYYHGARYYIPWLCRRPAVEPLESEYTPWSSYNYGFDNPVRWTDPTGMGGEDAIQPVSEMNLDYKKRSNPGINLNIFLTGNETFKREIEDFSPSGKFGSSNIILNARSTDLNGSSTEANSVLGQTDIMVRFGTADFVPITDINESQISQVKEFAVVMDFEKTIKDYELIDTFSHEMEHAFFLAEKLTAVLAGKMNLEEFKSVLSERHSPQAEQSATQVHQNIGNNAGLYNRLNDAYVRALLKNDKAIAVIVNKSKVGSYLGGKVNNLPKELTYFTLDNFYNDVVDHTNNMIGSYNANHETPKQFNSYIQDRVTGRNRLHPKDGRGILIPLGSYR